MIKMTDFDPLNLFHIATFRTMDDVHARVAGIKTIPVTGDEIQFKFPDIRLAPPEPVGTMCALPLRRVNEPDSEYFGRCVKLENIGDINE